MRIGMVTACYKPVINGVTRMVSLYKQELEAQGHEVLVFTLGEPAPEGDEPGVVRSPAIPFGNDGYYISMRYTKEAQILLAEMEIIHCHHLFMSVEMAHRYGRCPIVYTNHTRYDLYTGAYVPIAQPTADAIMRQVWPEFTDLADIVITPSESVRRVMLDFGVRRPIEVIENGVDLRPFRQPTSPLTKADLGLPAAAILAVYVGRLAAEKNLDILLEQFALAAEITPQLHLLLIGKGPLYEPLQAQASDSGLADRVHFTGALAYELLPNYLAAADFFVTASVTEVHPLTIIEALAAGLPVAGPVAPGIVDTVEPGQCGLLISDPERGLAAAITALAQNASRRVQMSAQARHSSERFDIQNTVAKTLRLYEWLQLNRPDLQRQRAHGRWARNRELVDQLMGLLKPPEKRNTGPLTLRERVRHTLDNLDKLYGEW